MKTSALLLLSVLCLKSGLCQNRPGQGASVIKIARTFSPVEIDGDLSEEAWREVPVASPFINKWPLDSGYADAKTEVRMTYNDQYLFVAAVNYQKREDLVIQSLKRDQPDAYWSSDGFAILIDPFDLKNNAFLFGVNAGGAQLEGAVTVSGSWSRLNTNWDNKWFSYVRVYDDRWIAELAIPFTSLRFKEGNQVWGLNFIRNDMKRNAYSTWSPVPLQLNGIDIGHLGKLEWSEPVKSQKSKVTIIPYASAAQVINYEGGHHAGYDVNAGLDAKIAVTSSLNVDVTYRPDFSNVEVDKQVTNVTRFSLLFPERRNFFLENADLFTNLGSWMARPFFSRRIGLHNGGAVPIVGGARVSGNITNGLRIGVMDIQTQGTATVSGNNYFVAAAEHRVLSRSSVKFFGANRQTTGGAEINGAAHFNRTAGAELQYTSNKGDVSVAVRGHSAYTPERSSDNDYLSAQVNYINSKLYTGLMTERIGENYVNDFGFIPKLYNYDASRDTTVRIGHYTMNPWIGLLIYPKKWKWINLIEPNSWSVFHYRPSGEFLERFTSVNLSVILKNTQRFFMDINSTSVALPFPVDLLGNGNQLPSQRYDFTQYLFRFNTDTRKAIGIETSFSTGGFYSGSRQEYGLTVNARMQPWGSFGICYLQNDIRLPKEFGSAKFVLVGPRAEISFSNSMWWTTFLQYNTQLENFNINSRFQWRYRPMSDVFLVYTDNYTTSGLHPKNRGVVLKVTYWLNI